MEQNQTLVLYQTPVFPKGAKVDLELRKPSPKLIRGGLAGGLLFLGMGGFAAWDILQLTPSVLSLGSYGAMMGAFAWLWPATAKAVVNLPQQLRQVRWLQSPTESLEGEKQKILEDLISIQSQLAEAIQSLQTLKTTFQRKWPLLSEETQERWEKRIKERENSLRLLVLAFKTMDDQFSQVELLVEEAKLDLIVNKVAVAHMQNALSPAQRRRVQGVIKKIRQIGGQSKKGFDSALRAYQKNNLEKA